MATDIGTWRIVDEQAPATVLFDLDDGTNTFARELQLRVPPRETAYFEPATVPGGTTTKVQDRLVVTEWRQGLIYTGQTYDQMLARARLLVKLLRRGGLIEFVPRDSAEPALFVDYEPGSGFAVFGESPEDTFRALTSRAYPAGVPIQILRQPGMREATRPPSVNRWGNGTMLMDSNRDGTPDFWTADAGTHTIQSSECFQISHNAAVDLVRRDYTAAAGTQIAVSIEARKVSGDRTVEIRLISQPSGTVLATATVTATDWGTRYSVVGTVAGGDTGVRVLIRYTGGSNTTVSQFVDSQLETGTLVASKFRVGAEAVSNDPAATTGPRLLVGKNDGDTWAPFKVVVAAEASDTPRIEAVRLALRAPDGVPGHRRLSDFLNEPHFAQLDASANGWTRTLENSTSSVADSDASGGNAAECTDTDGVMKRRVRITRTTLLDSLRGYYDVILRARPTAAAKHILQMKWSPSLADPAPYVEKEIDDWDWSDASSFSYVPINMGTIYLSENPVHTLGGLALEFWSRRVSGSGNLRLDCVLDLVPVDPLFEDRVATLTVPGTSREFWLGKDLVTPTSPGGLSAGAVRNNRLRLNASNEAGGTPPVGGLAWPVGRHRVRFYLDGNGRMDFEVRVRNVTDSNYAAQRVFTDRKPSTAGGDGIVAVEFDGVSGKSYQPQVVITGGVGATEYLDIKRIGHTFIPYLGASEQLRTDPENALLEKLDASGNVASYATVAGPIPFWAPPGRFAVLIDAQEVRIHSGSPLGESKINRDLTVSLEHAPRRNL